MRKIILGLILILSNSIIAQNLNLEEVLSLQKKDLIEVEEYLSAKDWNFIEGKKESDDIFGSVIFAFNKSSNGDEAESFIHYYYSDSIKRINVQIHKKEKYNLFITTVKDIGYKAIASKMEDNQINKVYQNRSTTIIFSITSSKNESYSTSTIYACFVLSNEDYNDNFKEQY